MPHKCQSFGMRRSLIDILYPGLPRYPVISPTFLQQPKSARRTTSFPSALPVTSAFCGLTSKWTGKCANKPKMKGKARQYRFLHTINYAGLSVHVVSRLVHVSRQSVERSAVAYALIVPVQNAFEVTERSLGNMKISPFLPLTIQ